MTTQELLVAGLQASIFLTVLTIGLGASAADLRCVLTRPRRLIRALLVLNVLFPFAAVVVCRLFALHPAVSVGLVTLAVAPVSNMFPKSMLPLVAPGSGGYAHGLFFASTVLSVIVTPLAVEVINLVFGGDTHVGPRAVGQVVVGSVLLPLGIGAAIGRWRPAATRWVSPIRAVSGIVLLACALVIVAATWSAMGSLMRQGTFTAIVLITALGLAAGHLFGGPDEDDRTVLAHAVVSRHPGVAVALASLTDERLAPVGVLLAVLVSAIAIAPYTRWRKRQRFTPHAASGHAASGVR